MLKNLLIPDDIKEVISHYFEQELVHFFLRIEDDDYGNMHHWTTKITNIIPNYHV